uniref:Uncharacterized protein n=1 Tax=Rhizophora mucronata TaxID=61149 RepID=A0A2P2QBE5_RHIMU
MTTRLCKMFLFQIMATRFKQCSTRLELIQSNAKEISKVQNLDIHIHS